MFRNSQKKWKPSIEYYQIFVEDEPQQEGTYSTYQDEGSLPISHPDHNQEPNATPTKPDMCYMYLLVQKKGYWAGEEIEEEAKKYQRHHYVRVNI